MLPTVGSRIGTCALRHVALNNRFQYLSVPTSSRVRFLFAAGVRVVMHVFGLVLRLLLSSEFGSWWGDASGFRRSSVRRSGPNHIGFGFRSDMVRHVRSFQNEVCCALTMPPCVLLPAGNLVLRRVLLRRVSPNWGSSLRFPNTCASQLTWFTRVSHQVLATYMIGFGVTLCTHSGAVTSEILYLRAGDNVDEVA